MIIANWVKLIALVRYLIVYLRVSAMPPTNQCITHLHCIQYITLRPVSIQHITFDGGKIIPIKYPPSVNFTTVNQNYNNNTTGIGGGPTTQNGEVNDIDDTAAISTPR